MEQLRAVGSNHCAARNHYACYHASFSDVATGPKGTPPLPPLWTKELPMRGIGCGCLETLIFSHSHRRSVERNAWVLVWRTVAQAVPTIVSLSIRKAQFS